MVVATIIISLQFNAYGAILGKTYSYGEDVDQYMGVWAKSNGAYAGTGDGYWQCVEYVKRFYRDALKVDISSWSGHAGTYYSTASSKGLMAFSNGGSERPKPNDILAFSGNTYGHVAIVTGIDDNYVYIIEQNWNRNIVLNKVKYNKATNIVGDNGVYRSSYKVQGWLRKEQIELTYPNGIEVWNRYSYKTVKWKYYGDPGLTVKIELLKDSTVIRTYPTFGTISIGSNGVGSYTFYPGSIPTGYGYQVRITSSKGFSQSNRFYTDISDNKFYVQ